MALASSPSALGQGPRRHHCALGPKDLPAAPTWVQKCLLLHQVVMTVSTVSNLICSDVIPQILCLLDCKPQQTIMQTSEVMTGPHSPSFHKCLAQGWHLNAVNWRHYGQNTTWELWGCRHAKDSPWTRALQSRGSLRQVYRWLQNEAG